MRKLFMLFIAGLIPACGTNQTNTQSKDAKKENAMEQLIGTWDLVSLEDRVDGQWVKSFGEHPTGYFSFGADGSVSVQFLKEPHPSAPSQGQDNEKAAQILDGYLAYFGTYTVDEQLSTFTTTVKGALSPGLIGTQQVRPFQIVGAQLIVGDQKTYRRTLQRHTR